jgi:invasion protein IalB
MPAAVSGAPVQKGFSAMNFRISAASVGPLGQFCALLAATTLTGALLASDAQAQAPAPAPAAPAAAPAAPKAKAKAKAAPKAAPAPAAQEQAPAPAPAAQAAPPAAGAPPAAPGAPGAVAGQAEEPPIQLIYAPWTKFCVKGQDAAAKQVCFIGKDGRIESGQTVIAAVIIEPEGEKKILRVTLPLGMKLVHGTRMYIDGNTPVQSPYFICFTNGCMADYDVTPELLANMKKGQNLVIQAINASGAPLTLPLPLQETGGSFAKAYEGPPTDPKQFEETQKKLQEELQKRAEEARKKLEAAGGATANPAAK